MYVSCHSGCCTVTNRTNRTKRSGTLKTHMRPFLAEKRNDFVRGWTLKWCSAVPTGINGFGSLTQKAHWTLRFKHFQGENTVGPFPAGARARLKGIFKYAESQAELYPAWRISVSTLNREVARIIGSGGRLGGWTAGPVSGPQWANAQEVPR